MRYSEFFLPTMREIPSEAEVVSHQLLLRAGMIRKLTSGIYSYLPLGYRVIKKIEQIIREEMDRAGAQEVHLPMVQPGELWQESGRWVQYGKELLRFKDRHEREYCLGPTHEEVITDLVRREIKTYRQLPKCLYQIQTKFRDEIRPRFGVMRCREFGMKDAYSFDADEEGAENSYRKMYAAYERIFRRCGLDFRVVEADSGSIGGSFSHEFMVMAETGEDLIVFCEHCHYGANIEKAEVPPPEPVDHEEPLPLREVYTPGTTTVKEVAGFFSVPEDKIVKTLIYEADGQPVAVLVRGDEEINDIKVKNYLGCTELALAGEELIARLTGAPKGYAGAVGLKGRIIADRSVKNMSNFIMGANKEDHHLENVNLNRDIKVTEFADLRFINDRDRCARCGHNIRLARGIEVGHVFKLGTKYSEAMAATFLDREGVERVMIMGCYGIGIGRTMAAAIEQNHDGDGIIWPLSISPFQVIIVVVNMNDAGQRETAEWIYQELTRRGVEVLIDDRDERAGVKFKDADLIGVPWRITVGPKRLLNHEVELRSRRNGEERIVPIAKIGEVISEQLGI